MQAWLQNISSVVDSVFYSPSMYHKVALSLLLIISVNSFSVLLLYLVQCNLKEHSVSVLGILQCQTTKLTPPSVLGIQS